MLSSDPAKKDLKKDTEKHRLARGGPRVRRALERVRVRAVPASPAPIYVNAGHWPRVECDAPEIVYYLRESASLRQGQRPATPSNAFDIYIAID